MPILHFTTQDDFLSWLKENHFESKGKNIFIYKKNFHHKGISYEQAVRAALCYGWIDGVKHSHDKEKYEQYFSKRRKKSNWSASNIKRMKELIDNGQMTPAGLEFFDMALLENIQEKQTPQMTEMFETMLKQAHQYDLFFKETPSQQKNFLSYIQSAKKEETQIRRCKKVIGILNGEKNNL